MGNTQLVEQQRQYATVARAIEFIREHVREQPSLEEIARAVHLSEYHLQRVFRTWAGVSPKRFLQYLTKEHARAALQESAGLLGAALDSGLSGPGRLHDLMVTCEAMTPGEIKTGGRGVAVSYGTAVTPFGPALFGWTQRGICYLGFCDAGCTPQLRDLRALWPAASLLADEPGASELAQRVFTNSSQPGRLHLLLRGTNFQLKVWEALLHIGPSHLASYSQLASLAGSPRAHRAAGSALARNRIAFLIPCHRVIRENCTVGVYHWGTTRKTAMQAWEMARGETGSARQDEPQQL